MKNPHYMIFLKNIKAQLVEICERKCSTETCGFIAFDHASKKYIITEEKNESPDPANFFVINPIRFLECKNKYSFIGVFHSHITGDESPSEFDIKMSEACCLPFIIYSLNSRKISVYEPVNKDYDESLVAKIKKTLK